MLMRVSQATFYFVTKTRKNNSSGDYVLHLVLYSKNLVLLLEC